VKKALNVLSPVIGIALMLYYSVCDTSCSNLAGSIFYVDLKYAGVAFMVAMLCLAIPYDKTPFFKNPTQYQYPLFTQAYNKRVSMLRTMMLSAALGGELLLLRFQIINNTYCPYCLAFAACLIVLYFINVDALRRDPMHRRLSLAFFLVGAIIFALYFEGTAGPALYGMAGLLPLSVFERTAVGAAFNRGFEARLVGTPKEANPYPNKRHSNGRVAFARAFHRARAEGWERQNKIINEEQNHVSCNG